MKLMIKSNRLRLTLIAAVSFVTLSLTAVSDYHKELSEHKKTVSNVTQNILKQHRNMDKNTVAQAKAEHADIESATKAKLADAKRIKNHKDRERAVNQIKDDRDRAHRDVNARKRARLEHSHKLKTHALQTTRERYQSIENGIRTKYGRSIRPVKSADKATSKNTTNSTNKKTKSSRKKARRSGNKGNERQAKTVTHTAKTKSATRNSKKQTRRKKSRNSKDLNPVTAS